MRYMYIAAAAALVLVSVMAGSPPALIPVAPLQSADLSLAAQAGRKMFFDPSLSDSGKISCATCHDPDHAYAPANDLAVQAGGKTLSGKGTRAVPSLCYKEFTPPYS